VILPYQPKQWAIALEAAPSPARNFCYQLWEECPANYQKQIFYAIYQEKKHNRK